VSLLYNYIGINLFYSKRRINMKTSQDLRLDARTSLKGNWGGAILASLLTVLLAGSGNSSSISNGGGMSSTSSTTDAQEILSQYQNYLTTTGGKVLIGFSVFFCLLFIFIGCAVRVGSAHYFTNLSEHKEAKISDLFAYFKNSFGTTFVLALLKYIFILLWTLLLIVPGIIASFAYSQAEYLLAENPDMKPMEAIKQSKEMMKGKKWKLFCLNFSFIGWYLLVYVAGAAIAMIGAAGAMTVFATLGIVVSSVGMLFLLPYVYTADAAFYLDAKNNADAAPEGDLGQA
jgi:uncharacterized membrane protein